MTLTSFFEGNSTLQLICVLIILFIQVFKLARPFLAKTEWGRKLITAYDAGAAFVSETAPIGYRVIEVASKKGLLEKDVTKSAAFLQWLREEAKKQGIALTPEQEAKAALIAADQATDDHLNMAVVTGLPL
jgi:hypothetical protein